MSRHARPSNAGHSSGAHSAPSAGPCRGVGRGSFCDLHTAGTKPERGAPGRSPHRRLREMSGIWTYLDPTVNQIPSCYFCSQ